MSNKLKTEIINNKSYYKADDLSDINPAYFYGCRNNPRNIVEKKNIPEGSYLYAYIKNDEYIISKKTYMRAKLYIDKSWAETNIKGNGNSPNNITKDTNGAVIAPPEIKLNDDEYFLDTNGNKIDIKIRGNRDKREYYFYVKDISKNFNLPNLNITLTNKESGYERNTHYKVFVCQRNEKEKKTNNSLYLTYKGLIRCLYVSRSPNADKFQDWSTNILLTHQFGSKNEKINLASSLMGIPTNILKNVLKSCMNPTPCIYMFTLGYVKDLRLSMNIDKKYNDDTIVCKYGKTDSLERRISEHEKTYGTIKGCDLNVKYYSYIDPLNITQAENNIRSYFKSMNAHIVYDKHKELIIVDKKTLNNQISVQYEILVKMYAGSVTELNAKIKQLELQIVTNDAIMKCTNAELRAELDLLKKDTLIEGLEKDREINKLIYEKDKQIAELKLAELKHKFEIELLKKDLECAKKIKK